MKGQEEPVAISWSTDAFLPLYSMLYASRAQRRRLLQHMPDLKKSSPQESSDISPRELVGSVAAIVLYYMLLKLIGYKFLALALEALHTTIHERDR